jgi:hypothetical protein
MDATCELTQLICWCERKRREETEFFLVYRKDCPLWLGREFEKLVSRHFGRCSARQARNHDTGWPAGCNMLAASAFIEMSILCREGICQNPAFLLFEPDCIPLARDWLDQLSAEWDRVSALGKECFGHWHQLAEPDSLHMNGNAVFVSDFYDRHPTWIVGAGTQGWDFFFRDKFLPLSTDSNLIFQHWNRRGMPYEELSAITKNGVRPAMFHGIKTPDGRMAARQLLFLQQKKENPVKDPNDKDGGPDQF